MDKILLAATTLDQSVPGSDNNEGIHCISQSSSITEAAPSDCLVSYLGHALRESCPSEEMQSVYSTAPVDWTIESVIRISQHISFNTLQLLISNLVHKKMSPGTVSGVMHFHKPEFHKNVEQNVLKKEVTY